MNSDGVEISDWNLSDPGRKRMAEIVASLALVILPTPVEERNVVNIGEPIHDNNETMEPWLR